MMGLKIGDKFTHDGEDNLLQTVTEITDGYIYARIEGRNKINKFGVTSPYAKYIVIVGSKMTLKEGDIIFHDGSAPYETHKNRKQQIVHVNNFAGIIESQFIDDNSRMIFGIESEYQKHLSVEEFYGNGVPMIW